MHWKVLQAHLFRTLEIAAIVAGSLGLGACEGLLAPLPSDAEEFSPPAVYSTWWKMTEACSGQTGSLGAITWYKTDKALRDPRTGELIGVIGPPSPTGSC
jgi:hypothetical protein